MNELSKEKTMTVKEVADIYHVTPEAIKEWIRELFPDKMKNGVPTYLNEIEVTAIKLKMRPTSLVVGNKTKLEKALLIKQAMAFQDEIIAEQQAEIEILKPKAIEHDLFMSAENLMDVGTVAKLFNIGRNTFFKMLRDSEILMDNNEPFQNHKHFFDVKLKPVNIGGKIENKPVTLFRPSGISYIAKRFNLVEK